MLKGRIFNAVPDTIDFRDIMYEPPLIEVPNEIDVEDYKMINGNDVPDQEESPKCIGFALSNVANYLIRSSEEKTDIIPVSPHMFYAMSKRYDEWKGTDYDGSSARGAMKAWFNHGVCSIHTWDKEKKDNSFNQDMANEAADRPLGIYYRVNHKDLDAMHVAIAEVGVLFATAMIHKGWRPDKDDLLAHDGVIEFGNNPDDNLGNHAFAIIGYDKEGFWIQNSWGCKWGRNGYGHISYGDWLRNGNDVWVLRLGVPVKTIIKATFPFEKIDFNLNYKYLRSHIIDVSMGCNNNHNNDESEKARKKFGITKNDIVSIFMRDFEDYTKGWANKRIMLYAPGCIENEDEILEQISILRTILKEVEVYPLAVIWKDDYWDTIYDILNGAKASCDPDNLFDLEDENLSNRYNYSMEVFAGNLHGNLMWNKMKDHAFDLTRNKQGIMNSVVNFLADIRKSNNNIEINIVGNGAGSIFLAPFIQLLTTNGKITSGPMKGEQGLRCHIKSCSLWAPACTIELFKDTYLNAINDRRINKFTLFTLTEEAEQEDNFLQIYRRSYLYFVSNSLEKEQNNSVFGLENSNDGVPILGMKHFINTGQINSGECKQELKDLFTKKTDGCECELIITPSCAAPNLTALRHNDFPNDLSILNRTLDKMMATNTADKQKIDFPWRKSTGRISKSYSSGPSTWPGRRGGPSRWPGFRGGPSTWPGRRGGPSTWPGRRGGPSTWPGHR